VPVDKIIRRLKVIDYAGYWTAKLPDSCTGIRRIINGPVNG